MSDKPKLQFKKNGSIRVTGTVDFVDADGNIIESKTDFSLCRWEHQTMNTLFPPWNLISIT
ncbi:MAG: hypothetical protein EB129_04595 [Actinobacteria bacterium]|nr:hypothetical protein [Actinomycetota bacterium]